MPSLESLAALATIAGLAVSVLALFQAREWLVLLSLCIACLAIATVFYARKQRLAVAAASTSIDGFSIDSLNVANLRRRVNRTFVVQEACHTARIEGEDMRIEWKYSGYCKAARESGMEFSVDSDSAIAFERLECLAYDLANDPGMAHQIRPVLIGTDGLSKKISVPFLKPVETNQPFAILLKCTIPRCVKTGFGYYISTLSFAQNSVPHCRVRLIFVGASPRWVRVYDCPPLRPATLLKVLAPCRQENGEAEYIDQAEGRRGQSARVYAFWRDLSPSS